MNGACNSTFFFFFGGGGGGGGGLLPIRKGPAGIQVNLNTRNLKKNTGGFFSPSHEMEYRWKAI